MKELRKGKALSQNQHGAKKVGERAAKLMPGRDDQNLKKLHSAPTAPEIMPFEATLAYVFRSAGGKLTAIEAARLVEEKDKRFSKVTYAYDHLSEVDKKSIRLEDLLAAAEITPDQFLGEIIPALWRRNTDIAKLIATIHQPAVMEATIEAAKGQFGMPDRKMLLDMGGLLPQKPGMQIMIDNSRKSISMENQGKVLIEDTTSGPGLPPFEQRGIDMAQVIRGDEGAGRALLEAPKTPDKVLDAEIVEG